MRAIMPSPSPPAQTLAPHPPTHSPKTHEQGWFQFKDNEFMSSTKDKDELTPQLEAQLRDTYIKSIIFFIFLFF